MMSFVAIVFVLSTLLFSPTAAQDAFDGCDQVSGTTCVVNTQYVAVGRDLVIAGGAKYKNFKLESSGGLICSKLCNVVSISGFDLVEVLGTVTSRRIVTELTTTLSVGATGTLSTTGLGYEASSGPGYELFQGAAHGGIGGSCEWTPTTQTYGSAEAPITLGSGGYSGGAGGGAISLDVTNLNLDGKLICDGAESTGGSITSRGGGSGGSIYIRASGTTSGAGLLSAKGGDRSNTFGGGGGGGRVGVDAFTVPDTWTIDVSGGKMPECLVGQGGKGTFFKGSPSRLRTTPPSQHPSASRSESPSRLPIRSPTQHPSVVPSETPTPRPTQKPSARPTNTQTTRTKSPSDRPSGAPHSPPSAAPSTTPRPTLQDVGAQETSGLSQTDELAGVAIFVGVLGLMCLLLCLLQYCTGRAFTLLISLLLNMVDLGTDTAFVISVLLDPRPGEVIFGLLALVFTLLPLLFNFFLVWRFMSHKMNQAAFSQWKDRDNRSLYELGFILGVLSLRSLRILHSRLHERLNAPITNAEEDRLLVQSYAANVLEAFPQLCIVLVVQMRRATWAPVGLFSVVSSSFSLMFVLILSCSACVDTCSRQSRNRGAH